MPLSEFRSFLYARWHLDDDPDGMLIRHCETGLTFRVVEAGYPLTVQELRPAAGRPCPVEPLRAYRIGCAARFVASGRYWVKTYRRARHAGAVYYTIYDARHRVMEDAPRLTFAQSW